jgi:cytochrome c
MIGMFDLGRGYFPWSYKIFQGNVGGKTTMFKQIILICILLLFGANPVNSQQSPPSSEQAKRIEVLVNKAAAVVDSKGKAALSEFRERGSEWWSGDIYVFAYSPDGAVILNPAFPAREGRAYHGETDKKGKAFHDELLNTAQTKGSGWVDYWLPKPGQTEPSQKWSYVKAVKAEGVALVGAGFYPE